MRARNITAVLILLVVAVLYSAPSFSAYPIFFPLVVVLVLAFWYLLRASGRTIIASSFGALIFACSTWLPLHLITNGAIDGILPIRDALIDPNQISVSHGAGGYVGIPGAVFAAVGVLIWGSMIIRKRYTPAQLETSMAVLFVISMFISFVPSPLQHSKAIILVVACIAWFASFAFDKLQRFLGTRDMFVQTLLVILLSISLLDLMHITARTFAYGLGI